MLWISYPSTDASYTLTSKYTLTYNHKSFAIISPQEGAEGLPVIHDFVVRHGRTQGPNQSKSEKRFVNQLLVLPGAVEQLVLYDCILWLWWDMGLDGTKYVVEVVNQLWVLPLEIFGSRLENYKSIKYQGFQIPNNVPFGSTSGPAIGWLHGLVRGRTNQFPVLVVLIYL